MKLCLLTFHRAVNYGAVLQAYATQLYLQKNGHSCIMLDFIPNKDIYHRNISTCLQQSKWNRNIATRFAYKLLKFTDFINLQRTFDSFVARKMHLTQGFSSFAELQEALPQVDVYITGSDQVWNSEITQNHRDVFQWQFLKDSQVRISLSSSFGKEKLNNVDMKEMQPLLKKYNHISVREKSALDILKKMGISNATWLLDPTLLIAKQSWERLCKTSRKTRKNYVLLFQLNKDLHMEEYAKNLAKQHNIRLLRISCSLHHILKKGILVYCPPPEEWLSLFYNATYIITDSFHGTAFSINFNKQFISVLPPKRATRLESILELTGLTDRILRDYNDYSIMDRPINYQPVNAILEQERKKADDFLKKALTLEEDDEKTYSYSE
jgi:hypothetical protein